MTPSKPLSRCSGQSVVEFLVSLPFWSVLSLVMLAMMLFFTARQFLDANVYHQARAQLYGNNLSSCAPSRHWRLLEATPARVELSCDRPGKARGRLYLGRRIIAESVVNLLDGRFERPAPPQPMDL